MRRFVVHDQWAVGVGLTWTLMWGLGAWLALRQGRPYELEAVTGLLGVVLALLVGRSLVVVEDVVEVRRFFGFVKQRRSLRDIERVTLSGDLRSINANRLTRVRPRVRVTFRDGAAVKFSPYASGLDALVIVARELQLPIEISSVTNENNPRRDQ